MVFDSSCVSHYLLERLEDSLLNAVRKARKYATASASNLVESTYIAQATSDEVVGILSFGSQALKGKMGVS